MKSTKCFSPLLTAEVNNNMMGFVIQNELSFDFAFYLMSLIDFKYLVNPGAEPPRVSRRPNFLREYPNEKYLLT